MASAVASIIPVGGARPSFRRAISSAAPAAATLMLAALMAWLDPTVFVGGGNDDWQYLQAARCVAEQGACIPADHWASRSPVVIPVAAAIAALGINKLALALVPAFYGIAAILLLVTLVQRQFGRAEALVAGTLFVATPVIAQDLLHVGVNLPELAWLLVAIFCLQWRSRTGAGRWCLAAGAAVGLAILTRATSLVSLPMFAATLMLMRVERRDFAQFGAGLASILSAQAIADVLLTGDLLHHWRLQLGHTSIASSELPQAAAASGSPLFNVEVIDNWRTASGIDLHWTVDGLINLLAHPWIGPTLLLAMALLLLDRRAIAGEPQGRLLFTISTFAAAWFAMLVFVLAIDPKPRMFEPVVAFAATIIGVLAVRRAQRGQWLALAIAALVVGKGLLSAYDTVPLDPAIDAAGAELRRSNPDLAVDQRSARFLALQPNANRLRVFPTDGASRVVLLAPTDCNEGMRIAHFTGWHIEREQRFSRQEPDWLAMLRKKRILSPLEVPVMCIVTPPGNARA